MGEAENEAMFKEDSTKQRSSSFLKLSVYLHHQKQSNYPRKKGGFKVHLHLKQWKI